MLSRNTVVGTNSSWIYTKNNRGPVPPANIFHEKNIEEFPAP
jgi:hypothetical protein